MSVKIITLVLLLFMSTTAFAIPKIQHWQTEKGTSVYFVETHELPMVDIRIVFDAGSGRDGDNPGIARLTSSMLAQGAAGLDADQISQGFEDLGAKFGSGANHDSVNVNLRVLVDEEKLNAAIENMKRVITSPDFPVNAFERQKNRTLVGIRHKQQSPNELASDAFFAAIYGKHPYAVPKEGTEESIQQINIEAVREFHRRLYVAANAIVAIVGDLDRVRAEHLVNNLFADLPAGKKEKPLNKVKSLTKPDTIKINHPSTQTHILVGQPGIRRDDPDLFPLYVGNHILGGGGMVSRLFEQIREKRGLSYSTYSYFLPMRQAGPFVAGLQTRNDQADAALDLLVKELRTYVKNGPTEEELEASKQNLTGGFPLRIDSNGDIINYLAMIGFYELPLDYLDTYNEKIMSVTVQDVKNAFQKKLSPDRMIKVMVGSFNK
jgi:zinc protease